MEALVVECRMKLYPIPPLSHISGEKAQYVCTAFQNVVSLTPFGEVGLFVKLNAMMETGVGG